jgi:hypothetical protein
MPRSVKLTGILLIPVILYFITPEWLDSRNSICLFKIVTGHECYGCGMTRAVVSAVHLQFEKAFDYNHLVIIIFPLLIYIWAGQLFNTWTGRNYRQHSARRNNQIAARS